MDERAAEVLEFWFADSATSDAATLARRFEWWFRGGADDEILRRFRPLLEQAAAGRLDDWAAEAHSRLALIIVLDQFPRTIHRGTAAAFAQDVKAQQLALAGLAGGHDRRLATPWQRLFFYLPLGHSEDLALQDRSVALADELVREVSPAMRALAEHSARQARGHRDVIARFGRHPHRNAVLGRTSTQEEVAYLAEGDLVHQRPLPPDLAGK